MPVGTAFHERTLALCESLNYREWSGYYTVSVYEMHHEHEYNAIRNSAALIDISPLFKYRVTGRDATKFVNRVISRDINKVAVDQVIYCCWCDPRRQSDRRRHHHPPGRKRLPLDGRRSQPALVSAERARFECEDRGYFRADRRARPARPNFWKTAACGRGRQRRQAEIFPRDSRQDRRRARRYFPHRLYRRPRLRNLDAMEGCGQSLGRIDGEGEVFDIHPAE